MSSYDELERQLKYHKRGRVEKRMLKGLLLQYGCHLDAEDAHPPGLSYQYYVIKDERSGVRGYLLIQLQDAGACAINRPCAQQYVGKSQSCMVRCLKRRRLAGPAG